MIMNGKFVLLIISVIAVGMFALPSTLALYTGSHQFVNGENVECGKCHTSSMDDIQAELESGNAHQGMSCDGCHGYNNFNVDLSQGNSNGHAASMDVDCIGCHITKDENYEEHIAGFLPDNSDLCYDCHGESIDPIDDVLYQLNLDTAAHHEVTFNSSAGNDDIIDRDQACIACHTTVLVNITDASLSTTSGTIFIKGDSTNQWDLANWTSE